LETPVRFFAFWYYAVPNYLLAALMYSLIARFLLSLFMRPDTTNYIYRFLLRITEPIVRLFGLLTPRAVPPLLLVLFCVVWLLIVRFAFFIAMASSGLAPTAEG
jgi:YggT family protein